MLLVWLLSILWLLFFVQGVVWIFGDDDICGGWFPVYTKWEFLIFVSGQVYEMYIVVDFMFYCKVKGGGYIVKLFQYILNVCAFIVIDY